MRFGTGVSSLFCLMLAGVALAGCGGGTTADGDTAGCVDDADCPMGRRCADGVCVAATSDGDREVDTDTMVDGDPDREPPIDGDMEEDPIDGERTEIVDGIDALDGDSQAEQDRPPVDGDTTPQTGYQQCLRDTECPDGLRCVTVRPDPLYGQCTKSCAADADCPLSPAGNPVLCHPGYDLCVGRCGTGVGTCPEWLECFLGEFCLEKVATQGGGGPGADCTGDQECNPGYHCVEGEVTSPYCTPECQTNDDCNRLTPGTNGICTQAGGLSWMFCMYLCGIQGGICPGDMWCEVAVCR